MLELTVLEDNGEIRSTAKLGDISGTKVCGFHSASRYREASRCDLVGVSQCFVGNIGHDEQEVRR